MRPIRLQLEGFTSFRTLQEIDFSDLDLFVITGPTGSGKTSILDAVTLALYGNVPRANMKGELRELISLGSSQAKVQLDFDVGTTHYRVARRLPRKGSQSVIVERLDGGDAVPEVDGGGVREANDRIVEILGLDYAAFTRAVLLPQGAFSEFLRGDASERRQILIRLLDLDRFVRAGQRANEEARALDREVTSGEELLEHEYDGVDENAVTAAEHEAAAAEVRAAAFETANAEARQCWRRREEVDRQRRAVGGITEKLEVQAAALADLARAWGALQARDAETKAAVSHAVEQKNAAEEVRGRAQAAHERVAEEVGDERSLAELAEAGNTLGESEQRIRETSLALDRAAETRRQLADERNALSGRLEAARTAEGEAQRAQTIAAAAVEPVRTRRDQAQQRALLVEEAETEREQEASLRAAFEDAEAAETGVVERLDRATEHLKAIETEHSAAAIRSHLHVGDDCPVCGSVVQDLAPTDAAIASQLESARAAEDEAKRERVRAGKDASARRSSLEGVVANIQRIEAKLGAFGDLLPLADAEDELEKCKAGEQEARERLSATAVGAQEVLAELSRCDARLAAHDAEHAERRRHLEETQATADRCRSRLIAVLGQPLPEAYGGVIAERRERLATAASELQQAEKAYSHTRDAFHDASSERSVFERELKDFDGSLRSERNLLDERRDALASLAEAELATLLAHGPDVRERGKDADARLRDVPPLPARDPEDREAELSNINEYSQALIELAGEAMARREEGIEEIDSRVIELLSQLEGTEFEYEGSDLAAALAGVEEAAGAARLVAERCKEALTTLRERLARKHEMREALAEKRGRMLLYKKIAGELRADRFIRFLLDESFHDLALRASSELELISAGRYSLAAVGGGFVVVDHANADERRSVVTLSGGETFLASLALALALAHGITDIAGHSAAARVESMFIDEGFGTLDPTALDLAVEALERLREGERMVGVITHVPDLAERIPAGIAVVREGVGSRVVTK